MLARGATPPAIERNERVMRLVHLLLVLAAVLAFGACEDLEEEPTAGPRTPTATPGGPSLPTVTTTPIGPTPITSQADVEPNAVAEADGVRVTLLQVTDPFEPGPAADPPEQGYRYVQIAVTLENRSGEDITTGFGAFTFVSEDGSGRQGKRVQGVEPYLITQAIADEAVLQGLLVGEVKEGSQLAGITYDADSATPSTVVFGREATEAVPTATGTRTPRGPRSPTPAASP